MHLHNIQLTSLMLKMAYLVRGSNRRSRHIDDIGINMFLIVHYITIITAGKRLTLHLSIHMMRSFVDMHPYMNESTNIRQHPQLGLRKVQMHFAHHQIHPDQSF